MTSNHGTPGKGAAAGPAELDSDPFRHVDDYERYAARIALMETNLRQVTAALQGVRDDYLADVSLSWRAEVLPAAAAIAAYEAGRSIGADHGITGWAARWAAAGLPAIQRLHAMRDRGAQ